MRHFLLFALCLFSFMVGAQNIVTIDLKTRYQTIDGFGASDVYAFQNCHLWREDALEQAADWLFTKRFDVDGSPLGIALSFWRFNLGSASAYQADNSQIADSTKRTECFLLPNTTYNFAKQRGQTTFLQIAKARGVKNLVAFVKSPPIYYTQNGLAFCNGSNLNLKQDSYLRFAEYIANCITGLRTQFNLHIDYISPFCEPDAQYSLQYNDEWTPALNSEIEQIVNILDAELTRRKLDTKIVVPEACDYSHLVSYVDTQQGRGRYVANFFDENNKNNLRNVSHVPLLIAAHNRCGQEAVDKLKDNRKCLRDTLSEYFVRFWASDQSLISKQFDSTMTSAIEVARNIHHDLVFANASSWQWRCAVGHNNDCLIREFGQQTIANGKLQDSRLLWTIGNYSRFVRPHAVRVGVEIKNINDATDSNGLMVSAYENASSTIAVVAINCSDSSKPIKFKGFKPTKAYITSDMPDYKLKAIGIEKNIVLPPKSVVTFLQ